ncbi:hypothetical protein GCM10022254_75510 [Actinomadura meridiana]|uniref:Uncharacterized protein n=1 Tax=Actinomadura meridiana TaxID=559626 RepID=A0ABP8CRQ0_9ACTN
MRALIALDRRAEAVRLLERNRLIEEVTGRGRHGATEALLAEALRIDDPDQARRFEVASLHLLESRYGPDNARVAEARQAAGTLGPAAGEITAP